MHKQRRRKVSGRISKKKHRYFKKLVPGRSKNEERFKTDNFLGYRRISINITVIKNHILILIPDVCYLCSIPGKHTNLTVLNILPKRKL